MNMTSLDDSDEIMRIKHPNYDTVFKLPQTHIINSKFLKDVCEDSEDIIEVNKTINFKSLVDVVNLLKKHGNLDFDFLKKYKTIDQFNQYVACNDTSNVFMLCVDVFLFMEKQFSSNIFMDTYDLCVYFCIDPLFDLMTKFLAKKIQNNKHDHNMEKLINKILGQ